MDLISHGLWGGAAFGKKSKKEFWFSVFWGMFPDAFAFGLFIIFSFFQVYEGYFFGPWHNLATIPPHVPVLYRLTHSIFVFGAALFIAWRITGKIQWPMCAWGLHLLFDIPTHVKEYFATPILWPLSDWTFGGWTWRDPVIFIPNVVALLVIYGLRYGKVLLERRRLRQIEVEAVE